MVLTQKNDLVPDVKSVILVESFEKVVNLVLAESVRSVKGEECRKFLPTGLPVANNSSIIKKTVEKNIKHNDSSLKKELIIDSDTMKIARKYFKLWRTKLKRNIKVNKLNDKDKKDKINTFIEQLKNFKKPDITNKNFTKEVKSTNKTKMPEPSKFVRKKQEHITEIYKSKYKAQQNLIEAQKTKLLEQEKIIENLKLGIILEETEKSLQNSKCEIREIFRKCSGRVKCKITPPEAVEKDVHIIELRTNKAPKIMIQMEKRAEERAIKRKMILQKKKMMEEIKKKEVEAAIALKKAVDDEQRQKNLDAIKEKRRLEAELERDRQLNKQKYLNSINKANKFYRRKLKRFIFNAFTRLIEMKYESEVKSDLYYIRLLQRNSFCIWKLFVKKKIEKDNFDADCLHNYKLMKKNFRAWQSVLIMQRQSMQVAEDLYDMKLQSKTFIHWHRHICRQQMLEHNNNQIAEKHYSSRILLQYFYQWKSLSAVLQLEKAKEEKKRKWREKVWEILPDYQPYIEEVM